MMHEPDVTRFAVTIEGTAGLEVLAPSFASEADARRFAEARFSWMKLAAVAVVPLTVHISERRPLKPAAPTEPESTPF